MKGKLTYIFVATTVLALCGCERLSDDLITYEGPRTISSEAQVIAYIPTESATPTISEVFYWLIEESTEKLLGNESKAVAEDGIFEFDFFSVTVSGENIVLDINENTSNCYREISVRFQCEGHDPDELIVTQLPPDASDEW